jgi:adenine-specific DNA glycosylase
MGSPRHLSEKEGFFVDGIVKWGRKNKRGFVWREKNDDFFVVFIAEFLLRKTKSENYDKKCPLSAG